MDRELFRTSGQQIKFPELLDRVQKFLSANYSGLMNGENPANTKGQICSYIKQYITSNKFEVENIKTVELVNRIYEETSEFSFLTPYLTGSNKDWEEININRWDDTKITYCDGSVVRSEHQFMSPGHAEHIIQRILRKSGIILDQSRPLVRGHLNNNIRVTVIGRPIIDVDAGISVSIRYINPKKLGRDDFLKNGMATGEMLDLLSTLYRYGISICLAGATGTGKTTIMGWILSTLPDFKRIATVENTTREFDLTKYDEKTHHVLNNVIHTVTKESDDPKQCITEQMLLEQILTFDPDYICMAEMKGSEAFETQEAARTGHAVISTIHAKSCADIYDRILDLCSLRGLLSGGLLKSSIVKAFPITFFVKKMEDSVRRITEICECEDMEDGKYKLHTLYRFRTESNKIVDGKTVVKGKFEKVENISLKLQQELRDNNIPDDVLKKIAGGGKN